MSKSPTSYQEALSYHMNRLHTEFALEHDEDLIETLRQCTSFTLSFDRYSSTSRWGGGDFSGIDGRRGHHSGSYRLRGFFDVVKRRGHLVYMEGSGLLVWLRIYKITVYRACGTFRRIP